MPRPDSEEEEFSDSDTDSDSDSSTHTITHNPQPASTLNTNGTFQLLAPPNPAEASSGYSSDFFASKNVSSGSDLRRGNHVMGKLVNKAKRKADNTDGNIHDHAGEPPASRARARSGSRDAFIWEENPDVLNWNEDEDDFDASLLQQHMASDIHPQYEYSQSGMVPVSSAPTSAPKLHPLFPQTPAQLIRQTLPHIPIPNHNSTLRILADLPVKQVPVLRRAFHDSKPQNVPSYFMQATGDLLSLEQSCERCQRQTGVYTGCVVVREPAALQITGGACACCWYGRQGSSCSFRNIENHTSQELLIAEDSPVEPTPATQPPTRPLTRNEAPNAVPRNYTTTLVQTPIPVPRPHPAYTASTTAQYAVNPVPTPAPRKPTPSSVTPFAPPTEPPRARGKRTLDDRVNAWEARYREMKDVNLQAAQKHLSEWLEDLTMRQIAINRVLMSRFTDNNARQK
ncbi:hypothetical protein B0T22DRAFT_34610 [Podospora appendiculata]|uniref:Uncharacterized protein n=1 Tax=Podospora appendiculata TaxID=314037 RepID=A0AAE0XH70_9PEZI|nr:hypothetical protein B0T22DRAFT_34610 [Podospora appendiculata]